MISFFYYWVYLKNLHFHLSGIKGKLAISSEFYKLHLILISKKVGWKCTSSLHTSLKYDFLALNYFGNKKNPNVFSLKFNYFSIFLYQTLVFQEVRVVHEWPWPSKPFKGILKKKLFTAKNLMTNDAHQDIQIHVLQMSCTIPVTFENLVNSKMY